jgi:hypothetical protein
VVALLTAAAALAQSQSTPVVVKLSPPIYPPLARQAHISGVVHVWFIIGKDGGAQSAEAADGPVMLRQAAIDSVKKSLFECLDCDKAVSGYLLAYSFEIREGCHFGPHCETLDPQQTLVSQSPELITISATSSCTCDPFGSLVIIKFRSAKCLYLWKCGKREMPGD